MTIQPPGNSPQSIMKNDAKTIASRRPKLHFTLLGMATCLASWSLPAIGAETNVNIINFAFTPSTVEIAVNDSVNWTWVGSPHTTTSDTGLWDSGVFGTGHTFSHTFTSAGSFPFHCTVHPFMTGTVTVRSAGVPPTVAFTAPLDGSVFAAPASLVLAATASDSTGSVTNVEFLEGASLLGDVKTSPYSVSVPSLGAGAYTFLVIATDNTGSRATNQVAINVVTPGSIRICDMQRLSATSFELTFSVTLGLRYVIQRSVDLASWADIGTNTATGSFSTFQDTNATRSLTFYRVGLLQSP